MFLTWAMEAELLPPPLFETYRCRAFVRPPGEPRRYTDVTVEKFSPLATLCLSDRCPPTGPPHRASCSAGVTDHLCTLCI
ncbi:hypothetical protein EYF80_063838 [Liparis tanakae]|uniref:Uncharacterized protein n=1 Tax=Liparis tanakae TaxID=230148 RepID=A0A4Z2EB08_9TELE|nr:hypothetical protein EYF80_063838 [Liparis tanakae]